MAWVGKVDPKDFIVVVSIVVNFYFLARKENQGGENGNK
jgi:hypothetical protein